MSRALRRLMVVLAAAGTVAGPIGVMRPARSDSGCSAGSLKGPYGVQASGMVFGVPTAYVGQFVFDGHGGASGFLTYNVAGAIDPIGGISGTYQIDGTCRGLATLHTVHHIPPSEHYHDYHLVVVDGGREALFETGGVKMSPSDSSSGGVVLSGVMKRQ